MPSVKAQESDPFRLIWGAENIGLVIGRSRRQTFHLLESGKIPARKVGGLWVAEEAALRRFFAETSEI